jgi:excisionase family DNA binding protein
VSDRSDPRTLLPPVEAVEALPPEAIPRFLRGLLDLQARAVARLDGRAQGGRKRRPSRVGLEDTVTVDEAATLAHVSPATIRDWLYKRRLASVKVRGRVCIRRADLERLATVRPAQRWAIDGQ